MSVGFNFEGTVFDVNQVTQGNWDYDGDAEHGNGIYTEYGPLQQDGIFPEGTTFTVVNEDVDNGTFQLKINGTQSGLDGSTLDMKVLGNTSNTLVAHEGSEGYSVLYFTNDPADQPGPNGTVAVPNYSAAPSGSDTSPIYEPPCYCTGTLIRTTRGDVAVEDLAVSDSVITASGAERPIKWIGRRTVDCRDVPQPEAVRPVCICAGAIAPGMPRRDLFVSPDHAVFFDDVLVPAKSLINGSTVQQVRAGIVTYYGLEFDTHDMVIAEGLPAESYFDDGQRNRFDNYSGDGSDLDPSKAIAREGSYRPLVINGPRVAQVRSWVDARAEHLGQPAIYGLNRADLTEDPDPDRAGAADEIIVGCLERISREEISGWVWTEGHPNDPVLIEIDLDGVTVAASRADEYRPDLHFAKIGVGRHGFRLRLPPASYQQRWMNVGVRVRSSGMHLTNSPAVIATETNETIVLV